MINFAGIASVILFYMLILGVGMWAARKKPGGDDVNEEVRAERFPTINGQLVCSLFMHSKATDNLHGWKNIHGWKNLVCCMLNLLQR